MLFKEKAKPSVRRSSEAMCKARNIGKTGEDIGEDIDH